MTYLEIIIKTATKLAHKYVFAYHTVEDIIQEGIIIGLEGIPSYDPKKGAFSTFIHHHINNRLKNFKRDNYCKDHYVCPVCNNDNPHCENCFRRRRNIEQKVHLLECTTNTEPSYSDDPLVKLEYEELWKHIDKELPLELRPLYIKWRDGATISHSQKSKLLETLRNIVENYE